jgi:hypothetical protein
MCRVNDMHTLAYVCHMYTSVYQSSSIEGVASSDMRQALVVNADGSAGLAGYTAGVSCVDDYAYAHTTPRGAERVLNHVVLMAPAFSDTVI